MAALDSLRLGPATALARTRRVLRAPRVIVAELLALAGAGVLMTVVPQATDVEAAQQLERSSPTLAAFVRATGLDGVAHSWGFLVLVSFAAASLANVLVELWRRALREYREPLVEASFRATPWRRVLPGRPGAASAGFRSTGRVGVFGTPLFHVGLLLVVLAGLGRALFAAEAVVELTEGETLEPGAHGWFAGAQGPLARPFSLERALRLEQVEARHYPSGELESLHATVATGDRAVTLGINAPGTLSPGDLLVDSAGESPFRLDLRRLHLLPAYGPAALLRLSDGRQSDAQLLLLREAGGVYEATARQGALEVRLRGRLGEGGRPPAALEVRAMRDGALLLVGALGPGQVASLPSGGSVQLAALRTWARFQGSADGSQLVVYLGIVLMVLGGVLMFSVVKVDTAVVPTTTPEGEGVLVALRASRFNAAYGERFERLVRSVTVPR